LKAISRKRYKIGAKLVLTLVPATVFYTRIPATGGGVNYPQSIQVMMLANG